MIFPKVASFILTYKCNLDCVHCYVDANRQCEEVNNGEAKLIVERLAEAGVKTLIFSGGEPLLRADIFELCDYASQKGLFVGVCTNGTQVDGESALKLKEAGVKVVTISIDGLERSHDSFRRHDGSFNKTMAGIKQCLGAGLQVGVELTPTKFNYKDVTAVIKTLKDNGVLYPHLRRFVLLGRGAQNSQALGISPNDYAAFLQNWFDGSSENGVFCMAFHEPLYQVLLFRNSLKSPWSILRILRVFFQGSEWSNIPSVLSKSHIGCIAGTLWCGIMPNGDVRACPLLPITLGNIMNDSLRGIWENSRVVRDLQDRSSLKGRCGVCGYRSVCGGCRSYAYSKTSDYLAEDPMCLLNR